MTGPQAVDHWPIQQRSAPAVPKQGDIACLSPASTGSRISAAKPGSKHVALPVSGPEETLETPTSGFVMGTPGPDKSKELSSADSGRSGGIAPKRAQGQRGSNDSSEGSTHGQHSRASCRGSVRYGHERPPKSSMLSTFRSSLRRGVIRKWGKRLKPFVSGNVFKLILLTALVVALFANPLMLLFDVPDDPYNTVLDVIMILIFGLFVLEIVLNSIVSPLEYPFSFFFWMDLLGTVSMVTEVSFLPLSPAGKVKESNTESYSAVLLRVARLAKIPARVGRLTKVVKTCFMCLGLSHNEAIDAAGDEKSMRNLSRQLLLTLSSKVSMLTIIFVICLPQFDMLDFPTEELSAQAWAERLSEDYSRAYEVAANSTTSRSEIFQKTVGNFRCFYDQLKHKPFKLEGFDVTRDVNGRRLQIPGQFSEEAPKRKQNIWRVVAENPEHECDPSIGQPFELDPTLWPPSSQKRPVLDYNIKRHQQIEAALDLGMFVFIVLIMGFSSYSVQTTVNRLVVQPLERMMDKVKGLALDVCKNLPMGQEDQSEDDGEPDIDKINEVELLEIVCEKIAKLTAVYTKNEAATEQEMANMDHTTKAVLGGMLNQGSRKKRFSVGNSWNSFTQVDMGVDIVKDMPVRREVIESWNLHVLELNDDGLRNLVLWIFFDSTIGRVTTRGFTQEDTFLAFHAQIKANYFERNRYHNYAHACDVLHTVFRFLSITHTQDWCTDVEQYSLLIAALAHDLGHEGKTNQFLVETQAEIACTYNDSSPLENYHCSKLFKICSNQGCNVLKFMSDEDRKHSRKVCIAAILHTDNQAHHLDMCKKLASIYEINDELFDMQARCPDELYGEYVEALQRENEAMTFLQLFLHLADVSNPLKPFHICEAWAERVLDEFFAQGDEEKIQGLPVGMLNDRDRVNRPGSQHGFIHFLVAPLVEPAVLIMQPLHVLYGHMAENLGQWCTQWEMQQGKERPSKDEVVKRQEVIKGHKQKAEQLRGRMEP